MSAYVKSDVVHIRTGASRANKRALFAETKRACSASRHGWTFMSATRGVVSSESGCQFHLRCVTFRVILERPQSLRVDCARLLHYRLRRYKRARGSLLYIWTSHVTIATFCGKEYVHLWSPFLRRWIRMGKRGRLLRCWLLGQSLDKLARQH